MRGQEDGTKRGRMDASAREQTHVRASIAKCSKEPLCVLGTQLRDARGKDREINTCYPVAEVFPSGWSKNGSPYAKRNSSEARVASRPISIANQFIDRMDSSNFS